MKSESDKILSMLEEGTISAAEAEELLEAVEDSPPDPAVVNTAEAPPDMDQVRATWRIPFNISLIVMAISGSLLFRTRRAEGLAKLIWSLLLLPVTVVAGIAAAVLYFSKDGPWLHLRVRSSGGDRFAFSLPFPLHWVRGAIRFAQSQVPDPEIEEKLDAAAEFLEAVETSGFQDPITIDARDRGDTVQIYLG